MSHFEKNNKRCVFEMYLQDEYNMEYNTAYWNEALPY